MQSTTKCHSNNNIEWVIVDFNNTLAENIVSLQTHFSTNDSCVITDNNINVRCKIEIILCYFTPRCYCTDEIKLTIIMKRIDRIYKNFEQVSSLDLRVENKTYQQESRETVRILLSTVKKILKTYAEHVTAFRKPTRNGRLSIKNELRNPLTAIENIHTEFHCTY